MGLLWILTAIFDGKWKKNYTTGYFYKKFKKIFFQDFFHLKLKIGILDLKNNFRFKLSDPKLVGIDTHVAIVPRFFKRSGA